LPQGQPYDFVLSNPPYIAHEDLEKLPTGVRHFEPLLALDGGPGGYQVLDRLIAGAGQHLEPNGYLIVEIGAPQEAEVRRRISASAGFQLEETVHDYSGHPRVLRARCRAMTKAQGQMSKE
jgi:release factor glutamine methyltransferase